MADPSSLGIYEENEAKALSTLIHEFIHYSITKGVVERLVEYVNMQKSLIESLVYGPKRNRSTDSSSSRNPESR